jgi:hypothetical protein
MLTVEKSSQTLVFFVIDNFVKSLLQNLGLNNSSDNNISYTINQYNYVCPHRGKRTLAQRAYFYLSHLPQSLQLHFYGFGSGLLLVFCRPLPVLQRLILVVSLLLDVLHGLLPILQRLLLVFSHLLPILQRLLLFF